MDDAGFELMLPGAVAHICRTLAQAGESAFVVGGSIRDLVSGRVPVDWDLATSATPERVIGLFRRVVPTGVAHGTVTVLAGDESYEVTTLRGEGGYADGRHPDSVTFITDIEADLARRDFTVNAMAWDPAARSLVDPFGGRADLASRVLRAVGDPAIRFAEDGLRVLRAARFAATLEMVVEEGTRGAMPAAAPALARVSAERKRDELAKLLSANRPSIGLALIQDNGLLPFVCPGLAGSHTAAWSRVLARVDAAPAGLPMRLAALLTDLPGEAAREWLTSMKLDRRTTDRVARLVDGLVVPCKADATDAEVRRDLKRIGLDCVHDLFSLRRADLIACAAVAEAFADLDRLEGRVIDMERHGLALGTGDLAVDGNDLMRELGIPAGRDVGRLLAALLDHVLDHPEDNTREKLIELARRTVSLTGKSRDECVFPALKGVSMAERTLSDFIELAIKREIEAHDFYRGLVAKVEDAVARDALEHLAAEEKKHRVFLEEYRAGKLGPDVLRLSHVVDYRIAEHLEKPDPQKNMETKDVYLVAAHREQSSCAFYEGLAALHPDGAVKDMLLRMANEERRHKEKVEYLYSNTAFPQTAGG
ncbi:MAG: ferritin family protein [Deltaproteobacteria bacterium]|nr:ferritin family protein [Deltaproteobacteria bacterium]